MRSGVSTACLYPMLLEDSVSTLLSMDFKLFEVFLNTCSECTLSYLRQVKDQMDAAGARVRSVHPFTSGYEGFLLFSDYQRRFLDGLEFYKKYFGACNFLGADILVLHGKRKDRPDRYPEELYFERYERLYELGKTYGVTVAQENVNLMFGNEPDFLRRMKKFCGDDCAFVLDIKQAVRGGKDPFALCRAMSEQIIHIHLNDNDRLSDCLLPGAGTMDFVRFLKLLKGFGFSGDFIIEVYRNSFHQMEELKAAGEYTQTLMDKFYGHNA